MDLATSTQPSKGVTLDSAPPRSGGNFMTAKAPQEGGLGDMANSPDIMGMQGLAMVRDGFQLLSRAIPPLAELLANTLPQLEQMVAQTMAGSQAGQQGAAPPGVAPMMQPPPGAAGASPAGVQGMAGAGEPPSMGAA